MEEVEDARQLGGGKIVGTRSGIESAAQAEIDRVGAGRDRCLQALLVAGGREQFRLVEDLGHRTLQIARNPSFHRCAQHQAGGQEVARLLK